MARGIDVPAVDWVIHFDLPLNMESYIHRCGRSGHSVNTTGNTLLLCLENELPFVELVQQKGIKVEELEEEEDKQEIFIALYKRYRVKLHYNNLKNFQKNSSERS